MTKKKILIRPTEAIEYLGIAQSSFYTYIHLGKLKPDGYGKRNQPMFYQETLDEFEKNTVWPNGKQSQGKSMYLRKAERPKEDQIHPTGAIIHWSERYRNGTRKHTYVPITCAKCGEKADKLDEHLVKGLKDGSFTGCCRNCYRQAKRKSQLKGKGYITKEGYVMRHRLTYTPEEWEILGPMCSQPRDYILEHRAVVALSLGRPLKSNEVVHHRNGIKDDNRPENLEKVDRGKHSEFHGQILRKLIEFDHLKDEVQELKKQLTTLQKLIKNG